LFFLRPSVVQDIERHFSGDRALLFADCCHSGSLVEEVGRKPRRIAYSVHASSHATQESTENWSFTQALVDGFKGQPGIDTDGDSWVSLAELESYIRQEMDHLEDQDAQGTRQDPFPERFRIAPVKGRRRHGREGEAIEVLEEGDWSRAHVVETCGDLVKIQWVAIGRDQPEDQEWVHRKRTRPPRLRPRPTKGH
jgi:hypothetical protein